MALLSAILVLMLMSALLVGFVALVNADQAASGINRDQTQAYAAAHAGVEKLTADLGQLFNAQLRADRRAGGGPHDHAARAAGDRLRRPERDDRLSTSGSPTRTATAIPTSRTRTGRRFPPVPIRG